MCGVPVYHYDHIDEYSVVQEHEAANLTLLCGYHHDLKTRGQLPAQVVRSRDARPHNKENGESGRHELFFYGSHAEIVAGGNQIVVSRHSASAIKIDGHSLIDFEMVDGTLLLNLDFRDRDGAPVLTVRRNELVHSTHLWDYEFTGQRLTIREGRGLIYLSVAFEADQHRVVIDKGLVSHNGIEVYFNPLGLCILNNRILLSTSSVVGMDAAISVGDDPNRTGPVAFHIEINREPFDRDAALSWARKNMAESTNQGSAISQPTRHSPAVRSSLSSTPVTWMSVSFLPYPWERSSCGRN